MDVHNHPIMTNVYRHLYKMKKKPALYFGMVPSLELILAWISGYKEAHFDNDSELSKLAGGECIPDFNEFVSEKYHNISQTHDWVRLINFYNINLEHAFNTFYKFLDEFLAQKGISVNS